MQSLPDWRTSTLESRATYSGIAGPPNPSMVYTNLSQWCRHSPPASHEKRDQTSPEKGVAAAERGKGSLRPEREQNCAVWKENVKKKRREEERG
ncbi:hypothetical protein Taro_009974 [Colocasia esculenta]|uniref:Uncharacterized protein n=1 Tax=Colocasia esculenta TaxID=4460 RepID=A0A843U776_COLES|nr:hypothetical protein [Colocasia esculenta]